VRRVVLDSSVLIDVSRGDARAIAFLRDAADSAEIWSITPVRTEVLWNLHDDEVARARALFESIFWLDVTPSIADRAGAFGQRYGRSHGLDVVDAKLAAAAEELSGDIATLNIGDFPMFPTLKRPY
jgi:predicted nucleic acid-binding protein